VNIIKKCAGCGAEIGSEGTVKAGSGNLVPSMRRDEDDMGPDVKRCWVEGICPCCLNPALEYVE
jgi:hypothetical protein